MSSTKSATGLFVNFKDFDPSRLVTKGPMGASTPAGPNTATAISIDYMYPMSSGDDVQARLVIECPEFQTDEGIAPPQSFAGNQGKNPSVKVNFDLENKDHYDFVGTFGDRSDETNPPTGVLGPIYAWCIEQVAKFQSKKNKKPLSDAHYMMAEEMISQKNFYYIPRYRDGEKAGEIIEGANPTKYFKLLSFAPGTPDENVAKFCLLDETRPPLSQLQGLRFKFIPLLSFRRIFLGQNNTVQMEISEAVVTEILGRSTSHGGSVPVRSRGIIDRLKTHDPSAAARLTAQYKELRSDMSATDSPPRDFPTVTEFKIDDIEEAKVNHENSEDESKPSSATELRRPRKPFPKKTDE